MDRLVLLTLAFALSAAVNVQASPVPMDDGGGGQLLRHFEYWFDDHFGNRQRITLNGNEVELSSSIDTDSLDDGVHRLNFRVQRSDGNYSSVSSASFLKLTKEQKSHLEYWIDSDYENRQNLNISNTDDEQSLTLDLSNDQHVTPGFHRLNLRAATKGTTIGPVYSQGLLKLAHGEVNQLEYWFDGNRNDVRTLNDSITSLNGCIFADSLDLSGISPGHHRLYYRATGKDGLTTTAIGSAAIMVKSLYRANGEAMLYAYSISVDDGEAIAYGELNGNTEQSLSWVLDLDHLNEGSHTLRTTFWNNYGISVSDATPFFVKKPNADVNQDGRVDIGDVLFVIQTMSDNEASADSRAAADVNWDGRVDLYDVRLTIMRATRYEE